MVRNTEVSTQYHTYMYSEMWFWMLMLSSVLAQFLEGKVISCNEAAVTICLASNSYEQSGMSYSDKEMSVYHYYATFAGYKTKL